MDNLSNIIGELKDHIRLSVGEAITYTTNAYNNTVLYGRWLCGMASLEAESYYEKEQYQDYNNGLKASIGKSGASLISKARKVAALCSYERILTWQRAGLSFDTLYSVCSLEWDKVNKKGELVGLGADVKRFKDGNGQGISLANAINLWATYAAQHNREEWKDARSLLKDCGFFLPERMEEVRTKALELKGSLHGGSVTEAIDSALVVDADPLPETPKMDHWGEVLKLVEQYSNGYITDDEFTNKTVALTGVE